MSRYPTRGFFCPECKVPLICIDSRMSGGGKLNTKNQTKKRIYCCYNCNRRFIGFEVFNPVAFRIKAMPKRFLN
jgi:transcriptional regulator NrdR family protein